MGISKSSVQGLLIFYKVGEGWYDLKGAYHTKSMTFRGEAGTAEKQDVYRGLHSKYSRVVQKPVRMA